MKFKIQDPELKRRYKTEKARTWRKWFAWHPVRVGVSDVRWLEIVERRMDTTWFWEYRARG